MGSASRFMWYLAAALVHTSLGSRPSKDELAGLALDSENATEHSALVCNDYCVTCADGRSIFVRRGKTALRRDYQSPLYHHIEGEKFAVADVDPELHERASKMSDACPAVEISFTKDPLVASEPPSLLQQREHAKVRGKRVKKSKETRTAREARKAKGSNEAIKTRTVARVAQPPTGCSEEIEAVWMKHNLQVVSHKEGSGRVYLACRDNIDGPTQLASCREEDCGAGKSLCFLENTCDGSEHDSEHDGDHGSDHGSEHNSEHGSEHDTEQGSEHVNELGSEHDTEHGSEHGGEHGSEHGNEHDSETDLEDAIDRDSEHTREDGTEHDGDRDREHDSEEREKMTVNTAAGPSTTASAKESPGSSASGMSGNGPSEHDSVVNFHMEVPKPRLGVALAHADGKIDAIDEDPAGLVEQWNRRQDSEDNKVKVDDVLEEVMGKPGTPEELIDHLREAFTTLATEGGTLALKFSRRHEHAHEPERDDHGNSLLQHRVGSDCKPTREVTLGCVNADEILAIEEEWPKHVGGPVDHASADEYDEYEHEDGHEHEDEHEHGDEYEDDRDEYDEQEYGDEHEQHEDRFFPGHFTKASVRITKDENEFGGLMGLTKDDKGLYKKEVDSCGFFCSVPSEKLAPTIQLEFDENPQLCGAHHGGIKKIDRQLGPAACIAKDPHGKTD